MFFLKKKKKGKDKGFVIIFFFLFLWCVVSEKGKGQKKDFGERNHVRRRIGNIFFEDGKRGVVPSGSWIFSATMIQRRAAIIWRVFTTRNDRDSTARD